MNDQPEKVSGGSWVGILLIIIGCLFLLATLDIVDLGPVFADWWPVILIVIGIWKLRGSDKTGGVIILLAGVVFLSATLDIINWGSIFRLWPLILIAIGLGIILKARDRTGWGAISSSTSSEDTIRSSVIFGGLDRRIISSNFQGGYVSAIFGGIELDFRKAVLTPEGCQLNITAICGGVDIIVPPEWQVTISGTPILGAVENNTGLSDTEKDAKTMHCLCTAIMGGVEIKN